MSPIPAGPAPELLSRIAETAGGDPSFIEELLADAPGAVRRRLGLLAPAELRVSEAVGGMLSVSLGGASVALPDPRSRELADEELEGMAGGFGNRGATAQRRSSTKAP